eukprot:1203572-Prymnesium_polylepis.1
MLGPRWRPPYYVCSDFLGGNCRCCFQDPALFLYAICEGCSCELSELSAACTITVSNSVPPSILRSSADLAQ